MSAAEQQQQQAAPAAPAPQKEQELATEQQVVEAYNKLRQDQSTLMSRIAELEGERFEHGLVLSTLQKYDSKRRCHRLVGGALIEKTVDEVIPEIQTNIGGMDEVFEKFTAQLKLKDTEIENFIIKYKIKTQGGGGAAVSVPPPSGDKKSSQGILAA